MKKESKISEFQNATASTLKAIAFNNINEREISFLGENNTFNSNEIKLKKISDNLDKDTEDYYPYFNLGFREKLWYYKVHVWYSFLVQDFLGCFKYASKWVDMFQESPEMLKIHPVLFLKANNYLM